MQVDFLLVGQGIAGTVLGYTLQKKGCSIAVVSDEDPNRASLVAAGLFNPITGKRMTKSWKADELFPFMNSFYRAFEEKYHCKILHPKPIYKPFSGIEEQNAWLSANVGEGLIDTDIPKEKYSAYLNVNFGGFETKNSGYIDLPVFLETYRTQLIKENRFLNEKFDRSKFSYSEKGIQYETIKATKIIFCEGMRVTSNPFFSWLPVVPSKGEILKVKIENFVSDTILNKQVFVIPIGNGEYRVGSTYQWVFDSDQPTEKGREELTEKLKAMIKMPFEITEHRAGIRPSVKDRKPIIGLHPDFKSVAIFNGLGTKGISLAPYFADNFTTYLVDNKQLFSEVNIERFYSLYSRSE